MQSIRTLAASILVLPLAACPGALTTSSYRPSIEDLDARLLEDCADPVGRPAGPIGAAEVRRLWGADRIALRDCGSRHGETVRIIRKRDAAISGR